MSKRTNWQLRISEERYREIYAGTSAIDFIPLFKSEPETADEFILLYLPNKLWRLNNIYHIKDKTGNNVVLVMNEAQHLSYARILYHSRQIILKSRQLGMSTFWLISFFDDSLILNNLSCGLMAQDGDAAKDLLQKIDFAWENLSDEIKNFLGIYRVTHNTKVTKFNNGSELKVRTSFRSGTLSRLHISEFGKISAKTPEKARETNTGSLQAIKPGNIVIIESTSEGEDNLFAHKWFDAVEELESNGYPSDLGFYPLFIGWLDDTDCNIKTPMKLSQETNNTVTRIETDLGRKLTDTQKYWLHSKLQELGEDFNREYPYNATVAFAKAKDGTYYGRQMVDLVARKGLVPFDDLYEPTSPVDVAFDLGINDTFVMSFFQSGYTVEGKLEIRLIDCYYNSGEPLKHYTEILFNKPYKYGEFILPHDAKKRELGSAKSIAAQLRLLGLKRQRVLPISEVLDGIQAVRTMMQFLYINSELDFMIKAFRNYTKEWNQLLGVWRDKPRHDKYSDPMDSVRYYAVHKIRTIMKTRDVNLGLKNKQRGMAV